jgi:hypothetical protein
MIRKVALSRQQMPTLVACTIACLALVTVVGLQAPAVSTGLRWEPDPRNRIELPPIDIGDGREFEIALRLADGLPAWLIWSLATLVALAILVALVRLIPLLRRRAHTMNIARLGADSRTPSEADARIVQSGLAAAIDILTAEGERDPGNAVVKAWQGLQDAAASGGLHRRPAETATEFTARILYRSRGSTAPIAVLLALYQRVRFGEHTPTAAEIATAQHSLAVLVDLWRADFPERRPTRSAR